MTEESESYGEYSDNNHKEETNNQSTQPIRNKYEVSEIEFIQEQIQEITKKIEQKKIDLRICEERYMKKRDEHQKLQGKPIFPSKEQKEKNRTEKKGQTKDMRFEQISKPKPSSKKVMLNETAIKKQKEITKKENEIEILTKEINEVCLENKDLKLQILNLKKQKGAVCSQLDDISKTNSQLEKNIIKLSEKNHKEEERIGTNDIQILSKTEQDGNVIHQTFYNERDRLEGKYHRIIEANIERERERKKEQSRKRQMMGMMAMKAMDKNKREAVEEQIKMLQNEDISDRTPVVSLIVDKWKHVNKLKKTMTDKYIKNANCIRDAFTRLLKFLSIDEIEELPIIYKKSEEQMSNVEIYISALSDKLIQMKKRKAILSEQIELLQAKKESHSEEKVNFSETKKLSIANLQRSIDDISSDIEDKKKYFELLQPETSNFLNKLNKTYISDYVVNKVILKDIKYNEDNIKSIFDNIQNYYKLINEFDESTKEKKKDLSDTTKELDKLRNEIKVKLENFKKENCMSSNAYNRAKNETIKNYGGNFDETIKHLANVIVDQVSNSNNANYQTAKHKQYK